MILLYLTTQKATLSHKPPPPPINSLLSPYLDFSSFSEDGLVLNEVILPK